MVKDRQKYKQTQKRWHEKNKDKVKANRKIYYENNRERLLLNAKKYRDTHRDQVASYQAKYRKVHKDKAAKTSAEWRKANPNRCKEYHREFKKRHTNNLSLKLHNNIRLSIRNTLNNTGSKKSKKTHEYLGCSFHWFVNTYWPSKVQHWNAVYPDYPISMKDCVIDHIKPLAKHDDDEIKVAWHFSNLQPLPAIINNIKSDKWCWEDECHWRCNILYQNYLDPYLPIEMNNF